MGRRWWLITGGALLGLVVLGAAGIVVFYGRIGEWAIRTKVLPKLEAKLGRPINVGGIDVSFGGVVLRDLKVPGSDQDGPPLATIDRIRAEFAFWPSLTGTIELSEVVVE